MSGTTALPPSRPPPASIPAYLVAQERWLFWRATTVTDPKTGTKRSTKVPLAYRDPRKPCDVTDPKNWTSYELIAAARARAPGAWDGPGFALGVIEALGEVVIGPDLDTCLDAKGVLAMWAVNFLTVAHSYTEVSPSLTGLKIYARIQLADLPEARRLFDIPEGDREQARTLSRVFREPLLDGAAVSLCNGAHEMTDFIGRAADALHVGDHIHVLVARISPQSRQLHADGPVAAPG